MNKTLSNLSLLRGSKILPSPAGYYLLILDVDHDETLKDFGRKRKFLFEKKKIMLKLWNRVIKEHFSSTSIQKFPGHAIIINIGIEPFIAGF